MITVTFQEQGQPKAGFVIPTEVAAKIDQHIEQENTRTDVGVRTYAGKADWFYERCYTLILKPVLEQYPDPMPEEAVNLLAQAAELQRQAERVVAEDYVQPLAQIHPENTEGA